ncbi:MAG: lipoprotein [Dechloromonas agitata]|uniref:Lipoprotein n=1 Tax=Dechloromonas agitata TaxID=73030 RepID=A0A930BQ76_9RHOO|nr:lipoprotein [Dechloromonas agitata]
MSRIAALLITLGLAACGMKGPLERPSGPAPEPLFGNPKPAPSTKVRPVKTGQDVSTDTQTPKP